MPFINTIIWAGSQGPHYETVTTGEKKDLSGCSALSFTNWPKCISYINYQLSKESDDGSGGIQDYGSYAGIKTYATYADCNTNSFTAIEDCRIAVDYALTTKKDSRDYANVYLKSGDEESITMTSGQYYTLEKGKTYRLNFFIRAGNNKSGYRFLTLNAIKFDTVTTQILVND